jgi:hypothetical protein
VRTKKIKILVIVGIVISGIILGAGVCNAYWISRNGFSPTPTYISCYSSFMSETKTAVSNACSEWNNAGSGNLVYKSASDHSNTTYPLENSNNQITSGSRGTNRYLMQCNTWSDWLTGAAYEADIDINTSFSWTNNGGSTTYDVQNAITHEIGHLLGLGDLTISARIDTTMYSWCSVGETKKRTLDSDDINGIWWLYTYKGGIPDYQEQ